MEECEKRGLNYHVSVGGLDSITLYLFLKSIHIDAPGISVSHLEDKSIQTVHKALGIERLKSAVHHVDDTGREYHWVKPQIIQEFGFPVLSKEIAAKIELLQNPSEKNATVRHAIITGETGAYGGFQKDTDFDGTNSLSGELKTFYDTELLENARVELFYAQFAKRQPLPANHGTTVEWRKWNTFAKATELQEGVIPTGKLHPSVL